MKVGKGEVSNQIVKLNPHLKFSFKLNYKRIANEDRRRRIGTYVTNQYFIYLEMQ